MQCIFSHGRLQGNLSVIRNETQDVLSYDISIIQQSYLIYTTNKATSIDCIKDVDDITMYDGSKKETGLS